MISKIPMGVTIPLSCCSRYKMPSILPRLPLSGGAGHCSLAGPVEPTYFNQFIILYSPVIDKGKQDQFSVNSAHPSLRFDGVRRSPDSKKPSGPRTLEGISLSGMP